MKKDDKFTSFLNVLVVIGGILLFASLFTGEEECSKAGCDNDRASGSSYCYLHKPGRYSWSGSGGSSSKYSSSSSSSASKSYSGPSTSSSTKKTHPVVPLPRRVAVHPDGPRTAPMTKDTMRYTMTTTTIGTGTTVTVIMRAV